MSVKAKKMTVRSKRERRFTAEAIKKDFRKNHTIYFLLIPLFIYYILFCYGPMYGAVIAFKRYSPALGIMGSEWVGFRYFEQFLTSDYFWKIMRNTILIALYSIIFCFPAPILLALLLNEVRVTWYKKTVQTLTYLPHFISMVIICGLIRNFVASDGLIGQICKLLGGTPENLLMKQEYFRAIYIISDIWQSIGWNSIIFLAALAGVDQELYDAAVVDGAGRLKQTLHVTLPAIMPTIIVMLILRVGGILSVNGEKVILLYNELIFDTADVIGSFTYRKGLVEQNYSYSAAVGLLMSVVNFFFVTMANKISKKAGGYNLW
ncbi:MAG TPA: sugar ABC transporter permease [Candidatus Ornithomonoglobus intestinigallinarum]|uniref:Sugar ABC transporter permease n=1 Tax=Candidatus Ornithomonoglobus intestinigallinarum TaxID=2840894 RepID=A0A9D1KQF4_9FIRM|nr:sugar ABC transporter permease [Candidatus Ornithomonoglobus intestinigallinarum]